MIVLSEGQEPVGDGGLTAAKRAVLHLLKRVRDCPDLRFLMLQTEGLSLLLQAAAELTGKDFESVVRKWTEVIVKVALQQGPSRICELSDRIEELEIERTLLEEREPEKPGSTKLDVLTYLQETAG
ncbi:hypothetical protein KOR42_53430 [Thalassoglobus neptunius]|uniref:Uncharacterized protein n=1 Tax=Thalassoglobus neptunius TaxID=1938619 RepID=A0A5C5VAJ5_9PLAN|nr:hypothetical protein [Thalassoglobus neptunius]TWT34993.1 hypothetical protein KOR42_53430 [Thalassoglobus neptunius]